MTTTGGFGPLRGDGVRLRSSFIFALLGQAIGQRKSPRTVAPVVIGLLPRQPARGPCDPATDYSPVAPALARPPRGHDGMRGVPGAVLGGPGRNQPLSLPGRSAARPARLHESAVPRLRRWNAALGRSWIRAMASRLQQVRIALGVVSRRPRWARDQEVAGPTSAILQPMSGAND